MESRKDGFCSLEGLGLTLALRSHATKDDSSKDLHPSEHLISQLWLEYGILVSFVTWLDPLTSAPGPSFDYWSLPQGLQGLYHGWTNFEVWAPLVEFGSAPCLHLVFQPAGFGQEFPVRGSVGSPLLPELRAGTVGGGRYKRQ